MPPLSFTLALLASTLAAVAEAGQRVFNIDGGWSPWSSISTPCLRQNAAGAMVPVTCGGGKQTRVRSCTNPRPQVSNPYRALRESRVRQLWRKLLPLLLNSA